MAQGLAARRLARLAAEAGGSEPVYVRRPLPPTLRRSFPADGWYWIPPSHDHEVYLGANEIEAAIALHKTIENANAA